MDNGQFAIEFVMDRQDAVDLGRQALIIAGLVCAFAGLCYAELASVLPVSGSAYTYSYATVGEFGAGQADQHRLVGKARPRAKRCAGRSGGEIERKGHVGSYRVGQAQMPGRVRVRRT